MDWQRLWPRYWFQDKPTNYHWDKFLNDALDRGDISLIGSHGLVIIGNVFVCIRNYPDSFGYAYNAPGISDVMPKVATRKRLREALISATIEDAKRKV